LVVASQCAFITFAKRESAEKAAETLQNNLAINKGNMKIELRLNWAKPTEKKENSSTTTTSSNANNNNNAPSNVPLQNLNFFGLSNPAAVAQNQYPSMSATRIGSKTDR